MKIISLTLFLFISITANSQNQTYENLVFEGAGIRGIAYGGVLRQLENAGITANIKKVGGTSAGAITALMISLGYNSSEIDSIISTTKFQNFNDGEFMFFGGFSRLNKKYGWYKGNAFNNWIEQIINNKTHNSEITFGELKNAGFKELYVTATCMNKQNLLIFSTETYPQMKIKDAVRISMSIPIYFEAVFIDSLGKVYDKPKKGINLDLVVDGGILGNYPIFMFDSMSTLNPEIRIPNYKTIGIRIDTDSQIKRDGLDQKLETIQIENMSNYLEAFYTIMLENLNRNQLTTEDWNRTISVSSVGIGPKIKKLSLAQKQALILSGEKFTELYFVKNK